MVKVHNGPMECCIHALVLQPLGRNHGSVTANPLVLSTTMAAPELLVNLPSPSSPNSNGQLRAPSLFSLSPRISGSNPKRFRVRAIKEKTKEIRNPSSSSSSAEEVTKKYGLEAGLWQVIEFSIVLFLARTLLILRWQDAVLISISSRRGARSTSAYVLPQMGAT